MKQIKIVFNCIHRDSGINDNNEHGANHPPKNRIANNADINIILPYSPRKNIAKIIEEYSKLYPATISASASGKSNGALFVSAKIETKKIPAIGNIVTIYHEFISCA